MVQAIITTEIFSIIISLILLYSNLFEGKQKNKKINTFNVLLIIMIVGTIADMLSWVLNGTRKYRGILYISCFLTFFLSFVISGFFLKYFFEHMSAKQKIRKKYFVPYYILLCISLVWTVYASITGSLFTLEDGIFAEGKQYSIFLILNALLILYEMMFVLSMRKVNGLHDTIAVMTYIVLPSAAMLVNAFIPSYSLAFPAMSVASLIVYVMLQSENEKTLIAKEVYSSELAMHDILTGLQNRFAFNRMTEEEMVTTSLGVIFSDVNGLKYTNDHYGHKAGDQLLCEYAQLLVSLFRKEDVYRISGDEFIVVLSGLPKTKFEDRFDELKKAISKREVPIASVGCAYSITGKVQDVLNLAEKEMYKEKEIFHTLNPELKRD